MSVSLDYHPLSTVVLLVNGLYNFLHFYTALSSGHVLDLQCKHTKHIMWSTHTQANRKVKQM